MPKGWSMPVDGFCEGIAFDNSQKSPRLSTGRQERLGLSG